MESQDVLTASNQDSKGQLDFADFRVRETAEEGAWLHLRNPYTKQPLYLLDEKGEPDKSKPCRIHLLGRDSGAYRAAEKDFLQRQIDKASAGGSGTVNIDSVEHQGYALLVAVTDDWENIPYGGKILRFDRVTVRALYVKEPWIKEQVDEFLGNRANFNPLAEPTAESAFDPMAYLAKAEKN